MSAVGSEVRRKEITDVEVTKDAILQLVAEGAPYIFITVNPVKDEDRKGVVVAVQTDIGESDILEIVLNQALESVSAVAE